MKLYNGAVTAIHRPWCTGNHFEVTSLSDPQLRSLCITAKPNGEPPMWWLASDDAWQQLGYVLL